MNQILQSLRSLLIDHLAATETLTADLPVGGTQVSVANTSRLRPGDEIYLMSASVGSAEVSTIQSIPDWQTLIITLGSTRGWKVSENAFVQKAISHQAIQRIHIGDNRQNVKFPTITLEPTSESNEWMTLGATSHEYRIAIRSYVLADDFETSNLYLTKLTEQIREILTDHIRPIIDGQYMSLLADLPAGSTVVSVPDTTPFAADLAGPSRMSLCFLRDAATWYNYPIFSISQEAYVKSVLDSTHLELQEPTQFDYFVARQAQAIRVTRLLYDSRPESISYGFVPGQGGSFLRASEITWFGKEELIRNGNSFS